MWIGCIQPPELFWMFHCSALFAHAEVHYVGAVGERLAVHGFQGIELALEVQGAGNARQRARGQRST